MDSALTTILNIEKTFNKRFLSLYRTRAAGKITKRRDLDVMFGDKLSFKFKRNASMRLLNTEQLRCIGNLVSDRNTEESDHRNVSKEKIGGRSIVTKCNLFKM